MIDGKKERWVVLIGNFTGDGSREHTLYRQTSGDCRVPIFTSQAAAENYLLQHHLGEPALIAEVIVEANTASKLTYLKTGTEITAASVR